MLQRWLTTQAKERFADLDAAKKKQYILIGLVLIGVGIAVLVNEINERKTPTTRTARKPEYSLLTGKEAKGFGVDAVAGRVERLEKRFDELADDIRKATAQPNDTNGSGETKGSERVTWPALGNKPGVDPDALLAAEEAALRRAGKPVPTGNGGLPASAVSTPVPSPTKPTPVPDAGVPSAAEAAAPPPLEIVVGANEGNDTPDPVTGGTAAVEPRDALARRMTQGATPMMPLTPAKADEREFFLPAGTLLRSTTLTGALAPASNQGRQEPHPLVARVTAPARLPNHFQADLTDCVITAAVHGSLSEERATARAETISCVRADGGVVEAELDAAAYGSDGLVGLPGRLVHRNGQVIGRALLAGFSSGIADAAKPARVPALNVAPGSTSQFETVQAGDIFRQGALAGASNAAAKVADYYLEMARNIFPVIEVTPLMDVDWVLLRGTRLRLGTSQRMGRNAGVASRSDTGPAAASAAAANTSPPLARSRR